jgi:ribosome-associated toxin RatA of RatAB toxin-antitoxin module
MGVIPVREDFAMNFEQSIVISAPRDFLFSLTQDYARRLQWDPFLKSARLVGGATCAAVGVRALCVARNGMSMETEYVSFNPPRVTAVKMTSGPWVIAHFAGSWRFEEIDPTETRVIFAYHLEARPRFLRWLLTPVVGWVFSRDTRKRLDALKKAVETGSILQDLPSKSDGRG